ncbi:hypothetical protein ACRAWF_20090 [Streptomyces sp. L7]
MRAAEQLGSPFPPDTLDRLVAVADGRASVIDSVLRASCDRTWRSLAEAAHRAQDVYGLLAEVSLQLLAVGGRDRTDALLLAAHLGYAHPRLRALALALDDPAREPWWQPLAGALSTACIPCGHGAARAACERYLRLPGAAGQAGRGAGRRTGGPGGGRAVPSARRLRTSGGAARGVGVRPRRGGRTGAGAVLADRVARSVAAAAGPGTALRRTAREDRPVAGTGPGERGAVDGSVGGRACAALAEGRADAALAGARRARLLARRSSAPIPRQPSAPGRWRAAPGGF